MIEQAQRPGSTPGSYKAPHLTLSSRDLLLTILYPVHEESRGVARLHFHFARMFFYVDHERCRVQMNRN